MKPHDGARRDRARQAFIDIHAGHGPTDDEALDLVLGLHRAHVEDRFTLVGLVMTHGHHRLEAGDIPYSVIRDLYRMLELRLQTPLLDLGCGYGRIGFYGALLWNQPLHGIEIVPERVAEARRVQQELGCASLRFEVGDLLTASWPEVSCYLMLNSIFPSLMAPVVARLRKIAEARKITIASISSSNEVLRAESWLEERVPDCPSAALPVSLRLFTSG